MGHLKNIPYKISFLLNLLNDYLHIFYFISEFLLHLNFNPLKIKKKTFFLKLK
jgi:hypothetical protein